MLNISKIDESRPLFSAKIFII